MSKKNKATNLPNFLIVGAAKSGTTSLYHYLKNHPEIFLSKRKEGIFFSGLKGFNGIGSREYNERIIKNIKDYQELFQDVSNEKVIGDASPDYLFYYKESIDRIIKHLGNDVKIIIILRNPIHRAFSNYTFYTKLNLEKKSFRDALDQEDKRAKLNYRWAFRYKEGGLYFKQVKAYKDAFKNIIILNFDDLQANPQNVIKKLFKFLNVNADYDVDTTKKYNASGIPSNRFLHYFLTKKFIIKTILYKILKPFVLIFFTKNDIKIFLKKIVAKNLNRKVPSKKDRKYLQNFYKKDILKLQEIVEFDVKKWLSESE